MEENNDTVMYEDGEEEEIYEAMQLLDLNGELPLEDKQPHEWPKRWREVDPDLGIRAMIRKRGVDLDAFELVKEEMMGRVPQREDETDKRYLYRLQLRFQMEKSMWKPGESGNPQGSSSKIRRAKKLPLTVKQAFEQKLNEELAVVMEGRDGKPRKVRMTKKEIIAKNMVDMVATGQVTFPDPKGLNKGVTKLKQRTVYLKANEWSNYAMKMLKAINPAPFEESQEIIQTVSFDIGSMMPKEAKMTVVKKMTGMSYQEEDEYLKDQDAIDKIIEAATRGDEDVIVDGEIAEVMEDDEGAGEYEYTDLEDEEDYDAYDEYAEE